MPLFVMSCDAEGGGTQYVLVAAPDSATAHDYMVGLDVENIGCVVRDGNIQDVEDFLHDQYDDMAVLCTV